MSGVLPMLLAGANAVLNLSGATISDSVDHTLLPSTNSIAKLTVKADGTVWKDTSSGGSAQLAASTDWIIPNYIAPGNYEVEAVVTSGSLTGGTTSTWQALTSDRTWYVQQNAGVVGTKSATITVNIRAGSGSTIATASYTLQATVT